jgi:hypothetical protein
MPNADRLEGRLWYRLSAQANEVLGQMSLFVAHDL